jgi:hypothetical protein
LLFHVRGRGADSILTLMPRPGAHPDDPDPRGGVWFFKFPRDHLFAHAFALHDAEYLMNSRGESKLTRKEADDRMLNGMLLIAQHRTSGFARTYYTALARTLYAIVRVFGHPFWTS